MKVAMWFHIQICRDVLLVVRRWEVLLQMPLMQKKVWIEAAFEDGMDIPKPNSLENICGSLNGEYRKVISRVFSERGNRYGGSECKRNENSRNING